MLDLDLKSEDYLGFISDGGPGCCTGEDVKSPLESLLNQEIPNYSIRSMDLARISIDGEEPYTSPVLILLNRDDGRDYVCTVMKSSGDGSHTYFLYPYEME